MTNLSSSFYATNSFGTAPWPPMMQTMGNSDYLPNTIWVMMFMESQGYIVSSNILEQDNESAIKLAKNGRTSAGHKSRHWYRIFLVKGSDQVQWCCHPALSHSTNAGWYFYQTITRQPFCFFNAVVLGHHHVDTLLLRDIIAEPLKECVGDMWSGTSNTYAGTQHG